MSKQATPALIGGFVVGAVVLLITAVLIFSSNKFFTPKKLFVVYFSGSLNGLTIGAPVKLKGVQVGTVTGIVVQYEGNKLGLMTPVYFEFEPEKLASVGTLRKLPFEERVKALIERGLRAQLAMQSLVTGQLYIELAFFPNTPIKLIKADSKVPEIPAIPSDTEEIKDTISHLVTEIRRLPLEKIFATMLVAVENINKVTGSKAFQHSAQAADETLQATHRLITHIDNKVDPLAASLESMLADTRKLLRRVDGQVEPLSASTKQALVSVQTAMEQAEAAMASVQNITGETSPVYNDLSTALGEISKAARSLRVLTDYLQRHPDSLIYGKGASRGH
jgi:phospholipid/cholesterol/gamma-HCH transport system substrate-binding protein